jgi:hypothetical protein
MSVLPNLTNEDRALLGRPVEKTEDQGTYTKCEHRGGGVSYWRYLRPENLALIGDYKPWTWVVIVVDGPGVPREGYPVEEESVPQSVRKLRRERKAR